MPRVTFITASGDEVVVPKARRNLMKAAVANNIEGIYGDCGGVCSCATCHVHIDPDWIEKVGAASELELEVLALQDNATEFSRLGCQVELSDELEGLVVRVAGG